MHTKVSYLNDIQISAKSETDAKRHYVLLEFQFNAYIISKRFIKFLSLQTRYHLQVLGDHVALFTINVTSLVHKISVINNREQKN